MASSISKKIMDILSRPLDEDVDYEILGGPTPTQVQTEPIDYAKNVKRAQFPTAPGSDSGPFRTPGVGTTGGEDDDDDESEDDDDTELSETFSTLLSRLAEDDEDSEDNSDEDDEDSDEPTETLPDVDSMLDDPDALVTPSPSSPMAESRKRKLKESARKRRLAEEDDEDNSDSEDNDEPTETLPDVDSMLDDPDELVTPAPGVEMAEDEDDDKDHDDDDKDHDDDDDDKKADVSEDIKAILADTNLSETATNKAVTIFKAAVNRRVNEEKNRVQKIATKKLKEAFNVIKVRSQKQKNVFENKLGKQVDRYLNYVVENWMTDNKLAVERGIRAELAEDFIKGLKNLFVEHYIEVPDSKVDVVETLGKKVNSLEARLNEETQTNIKMRSSLTAYRKAEVVNSLSAGLADTQKEKFKGLVEGLEYTTRKEFEKQAQELKERYSLGSAPKRKTEEPLFETTTIQSPDKKVVDSEMSQYVNMLSKIKK